ncbi:Extracellular metalloprotease SMAC-06893 [Mycena indigotica]|uniref:Extracellular metalloprotease SMAC-06893 n=1 Tax=Mycena indigotica TaxID=2126181 RepID=A0A8H6SGU9_9AGAR|nr:Extracellular metalloprotease SMAC-06893 [Mycena indigotica]KAF7298718.1 Extracellular metalloprotease SMAC-06893 [Mycena indigotica]
MITFSVLALALNVFSALGHHLQPVSRGLTLISSSRGCATEISAAHKDAVEADFAARRAGLAAKKAAAITIPTYLHVVRHTTTLAGGDIPDSQITAQMAVLNAAFANTSYTFQLVETTRTTNSSWFRRASPFGDGLLYQNAMKAALRRGGPETLNLYSVGFTDDEGLLGYGTFPSEYEEAPQDDGVVFLYSTVPEGTQEPYNLGGTVQHEVGHWVGLYHTFNEGDLANTCDGSSDLVDDTPIQRWPTGGCPTRSDTCPEVDGDDPIHNYMDYSDDICYDNFTPGQVERIAAQLSVYRGL